MAFPAPSHCPEIKMQIYVMFFKIDYSRQESILGQVSIKQYPIYMYMA